MKVLINNRQRRIRLNLKQIRKDSYRALDSLGLGGAELGILFVGEKTIRALNLRYRGMDKTTDVLSFPIYNSPLEFPSGGKFLLGDIVINPSLARRQCKEHGLTFNEELRWLIIHGLLHLLGYDHERSGYAERKMRRKELELLERLGGWFRYNGIYDK